MLKDYERKKGEDKKELSAEIKQIREGIPQAADGVLKALFGEKGVHPLTRGLPGVGVAHHVGVALAQAFEHLGQLFDHTGTDVHLLHVGGVALAALADKSFAQHLGHAHFRQIPLMPIRSR